MIAHSSPAPALDPASFIVRARYELLGRLVERVLQGERFLALSGAPGTGKSVMARAIHGELLSRSVTVFPIERGESDNIGSRSIICQLLHKPEAAFQPDDVETMFDTLAIGGDHGQRRAIIIDDAERLRPDALQYLRLVSNMVPEQMPPVVFVGHSSFWDVPGQPGSSDAHDLITCRVELERLSDEEAHAFISEKLPGAAHPRFDDATREALIRHAEGSIGRLAALLTAAQDMPSAKNKPGDRQTVTTPPDGQKPALTIEKPLPLAAHGSALTIRPTSDLVLNPVADSPPVEHTRNSARWAHRCAPRDGCGADADSRRRGRILAVGVSRRADPKGGQFRRAGARHLVRRWRRHAAAPGGVVVERGPWQC
jgi:type II secretory pathway predicted ATPase ExeA